MGEVTGRDLAIGGMRVQAARLRVIMENLANAESTAATPGGDPYRRRHVLFEPVGEDPSPRLRVAANTSAFPLRRMADHPAADAAGLVKLPNVNSVAETMDLRNAIGAYQKNLDVVSAFERIEQATIDVLKA
ncbi:flagellar basal-body rod protein FlgC [Methylobacterium sp. PvP062]|jgi:flagellar basal-body rod protein FlgC|uniref:Flagellar basal body rod protein FlgC n=3 Tax=Methylobacterium TaxID=407 RepID=A0ABV1R6L4_9HYPH|nr:MULTISPECIES: hypothetical protein [Methylobacterium]MBE7196232.1 flagellar basal body rod protein FlgC [Parafilimonas terrae]MCX7334571.1 flagellar basal body rod protein FlgC [Hyphomicrobiales bacterium]GAN49850.1 flagellar basal-body rod protein FlgC [Methylobacterium sp. ME121]AWV15181.1 hypothetical protein A3862_06335 [Methylobacterium sp. XJLW]KIU27163.1 hypothetical protein SR39_30780 [Methylobacterium radiotolerans]